MSEIIPPSRSALAEALKLSADLLQNIELSDISLTNVALKASRLARLLNDFDYQKVMTYEAGGYPVEPTGVTPEVWNLAVKVGRKFAWTDPISRKTDDRIYTESVEELAAQIQISEPALAAARDPAGSSKENSNPWAAASVANFMPKGNVLERNAIRQSASTSAQRLAGRRTMIYQYVMEKYYELRFSGIADDIFTRIRDRVDTKIGGAIPGAIQKLSAVYDNLQSENPEDWSNAVHSCRRILQDLADAVFPPTSEVRTKEIDGREREIHLGPAHYINRIIAFVEDSGASRRFAEIAGSQLSFLGDRLDSVFRASQKGSHATIVTREEADRYVVYTYLIVGDILSLRG